MSCTKGIEPNISNIHPYISKRTDFPPISMIAYIIDKNYGHTIR